MKKFEYKVLRISVAALTQTGDSGGPLIEEDLNVLGGDGWEYRDDITVEPHNFIVLVREKAKK